ncbi:MAG: peptide chain release factor N(5)-glutamine methyltransferase [Anaerolineaceae bacterium]|nr:peptide chain release factor N(5)-glutamine methyltransferase [Anaerolineaceae bacterium]
MTRSLAVGNNIREALVWAKQQLAALDEAALEAQLLLAQALAEDRTHILSHPEKRLSDSERFKFGRAVERRAKGEPLAYILGQRAFYDRGFLVTPATLIPRPETEIMLEAALTSVSGAGSGVALADVGTGCGALAICFAALRPRARVWASDVCEDAISVAQVNGTKEGVSVAWMQGNLLQPYQERGIRLDRIMSNLPYVPTEVLRRLEVSEFEPWLALDGGVDGLALIRRLLDQIADCLAPRGQAWLEIGADQGAAVCAYVKDVLPLAEADLLPDLVGHDRVLHLQMP